MPESRGIEIVLATGEQIDAVRDLWREYWDVLFLPDDFQNFAEESRTLPGVYASPEGRLLLALVRSEPAGTAALRPLNKHACEGKRFYIRPAHRGKGLGRSLLNRLVEEARSAGYREMFADTLPSMTSALQLYRQAGFFEVPPYSSHPTSEAIFMKLLL